MSILRSLTSACPFFDAAAGTRTARPPAHLTGLDRWRPRLQLEQPSRTCLDSGARAVIPTKSNEAPVARPEWIYHNRNIVERLWARLKRWHAVATRYEKTACSFLGMLCMAVIPTNLWSDFLDPGLVAKGADAPRFSDQAIPGGAAGRQWRPDCRRRAGARASRATRLTQQLPDGETRVRLASSIERMGRDCL